MPIKDKEGDPRIGRLTADWFEVYRAHYGVPPMWGGKDAKSLQRVLSWADKAFPGAAEDTLRKAFGAYLAQNGLVAGEKHPFSWFSANPAKFAIAPKIEPKSAPTEPTKEPDPSLARKLTVPEIQDYIQKTGVRKWLKFFFIPRIKRLKHFDPDFAQRCIDALVGVAGEADARRMYKEVENEPPEPILKEMPK